MVARKDARRRALLDSATRLFGEHGYHATTVPMIVNDADSSTGSFYSYFRNKEDVFGAALEALGERVAAVIEEARAKVEDPVMQIRAAVESLFLFLAENPREARILIVESSGLSPALEEIHRRAQAKHADLVRSTIEGDPGRFVALDAAIAGRCLVGAVFEALYSWLEMPSNDRPEAAHVAREVADYNVRAIERRG